MERVGMVEATGAQTGMESGAGGPGVAAARGRAREAASRWMSEHVDVLWRFCIARTRDESVAEEIVQETIVAAMQGYARFNSESSERTWLLSIAVRKIADHYRKLARQRKMMGGARDEEIGGVEEGEEFRADGHWARLPVEFSDAAEGSEERAREVAALRGCLEALPPHLAEVVWLREVGGVPGEELCKLTGVSATNLWTRLHRARGLLRACIERSLGEEKEAGA